MDISLALNIATTVAVVGGVIFGAWQIRVAAKAHHFCLSVTGVDETIAKLRARGVVIVNEPFVLPAISRRLAFFADPFGNLVELAELLPQPDGSDGRPAKAEGLSSLGQSIINQLKRPALSPCDAAGCAGVGE